MFRWLSGLLVAAFTVAVSPAHAAEPNIPQFWDAKERLSEPDLSRFARIRFLTTVDFPPFNFLDGNGLISGFHVDLARAVCDVLQVLDRCQIQALPWEELEGAIARGEGDALIAGLALTPERRLNYAFTRSYLRFPARFVVASGSTLEEPIYRNVSGRRVGVLAGSQHEKMLRDYFPEAKVVLYSREDWLYDGMRTGETDATFGDGLRLSFWLAGSDSANCCRFAGGPYIAPEYFGAGLAIAVRQGDAVLAEAFDYALREINMNGAFEELYLRYFPVSFF
ncbi:MAG: transporter substrate-binding domain-containing protein [Rhizobiaceae bacterium]|nr:transporter substrate-binding domain-containing protein [Rhizobiaceae bacterium]